MNRLLKFLSYMLVAVVSLATAQVPVKVPLSFYLPAGESYDPGIPTPESFFGFQVGEWHLSPEQIHAYYRELDRLSDRFSIVAMGRSYEQREMILAIVSSPENHANLPRIKEEHIRLSDPSTSSSLNVEQMPVVVWMGYSVHGNEASGSNASVLVAYFLAAARGNEVDRILKNAVVLLNPSINPDGLNRFASWVNANRGAQVIAAPESREHNEPWPGGRTNHYWFDLNRDWMPVQHPESRARIDRFYEWRPNLLTDHHEMGTSATFFFQPGVPSRNNPLAAPLVQNLTDRLASYHAKLLDSTGALYYSHESYDDFYVGKGSSYPDVVGSVGILFEQASSRGTAQEGGAGIVTFPYAVRNHVTASFSSLRGALDLRVDFLRHQREAAASAMRLADQSAVKAYIFGSPRDPMRSALLVDILLRHRIEVRRLSKSVRDGNTTLEPGSSYVIPVRQSQYRLLTSLFERRTTFDDSLFYDVSAWNLSLAFGLHSIEWKSSVEDVSGARLTSIDFPTASVGPVDGAYALAFSWDHTFAPRSLERLLLAGVDVRTAVKPFEVKAISGPKSFDRGAIVIPMGTQSQHRDTIVSIIRTIGLEDGITVDAILSGQSNSGIDLGSPNMVPLKLPKVAMLAGAGVGATNAGEIWHLLDMKFEVPVVLLDPTALGRTDLTSYNVLVMPSGSYSGIDSAGRGAMGRWIREGNTLIALEQAAEWVITNKFSTVKLKKAEELKSSILPRMYGDEESFRAARSVPGSIVSVTVDPTHPILFGVNTQAFALFKSTGLALEPSKSPFATPVRFTDRPLMAGYLHSSSRTLIAGGGAVEVSALGSGRTILFTDSPAFRAYWYGTSRLFLNAVFFGPTIRLSSTRPEE